MVDRMLLMIDEGFYPEQTGKLSFSRFRPFQVSGIGYGYNIIECLMKHHTLLQ